MPACARPGVYIPRQTHDCDAAVLVRRHLPGFLARLEEAGHALPGFVKAELEGFATCGDFERGFVRTACRTCGDELRVPFSCKGRGFCPSCMGRRMAEGAALLVDHVLPAVGYRQWVLSFTGRMAVRLGYDQVLLAKVAEAFARAVMHDMRWSVKERHGRASVEPLHAGVFTVVQRFRSDLGLYVHLHSLVTDGAFEEAGADVRFLPAATPTPARMTAVLAQVHKAVAAVLHEPGPQIEAVLVPRHPHLAASMPQVPVRRRGPGGGGSRAQGGRTEARHCCGSGPSSACVRAVVAGAGRALAPRRRER